MPHISLVFREMWDTTGLSLQLLGCVETLNEDWLYPTSREKRARYGAPRIRWHKEIPKLRLSRYPSHDVAVGLIGRHEDFIRIGLPEAGQVHQQAMLVGHG